MSTFPSHARMVGDLDNDGVATVMDLARLIGHSSGLQPLSDADAVWADLNHDGIVNNLDRDELVKEILQTRTPEELPLATIRRISPANGESNVAVTRETVLDFSIPL